MVAKLKPGNGVEQISRERKLINIMYPSILKAKGKSMEDWRYRRRGSSEQERAIIVINFAFLFPFAFPFAIQFTHDIASTFIPGCQPRRLMHHFDSLWGKKGKLRKEFSAFFVDIFLDIKWDPRRGLIATTRGWADDNFMELFSCSERKIISGFGNCLHSDLG